MGFGRSPVLEAARSESTHGDSAAKRTNVKINPLLATKDYFDDLTLMALALSW
jgi:hypothetical protein